MPDIFKEFTPNDSGEQKASASVPAEGKPGNDLQDFIRRNLPDGERIAEYVKTCPLAELGQIAEAVWQVSGGENSADNSLLWKIVDKYYGSDPALEHDERKSSQQWVRKAPAFSVAKAAMRTFSEKDKQSVDKEAEEQVVKYLKSGYQSRYPELNRTRVSLLLAALDLSQDKSRPRGKEEWQNFIADIFEPEIADLREFLAKIAGAGIKAELPPVWPALEAAQGKINIYMAEVGNIGGNEAVSEVCHDLGHINKAQREVYDINERWKRVRDLVELREEKGWDKVIAEGFDMIESSDPAYDGYNLVRLFRSQKREIEATLQEKKELEGQTAVKYWTFWEELARQELERVETNKPVIEEGLKQKDRWAGLGKINALSTTRKEITRGMNEAERNYLVVKRVTTGVMTLAEVVSGGKSETAIDKASATAAIEQMEKFLMERRADFAECDLGEELSYLIGISLDKYKFYKVKSVEGVAEKISQALEFFQKKLKDLNEKDVEGSK